MSSLAGHSFKWCQDYHCSSDEIFFPGVKWWRTAPAQSLGRATSSGGKQKDLGNRDIFQQHPWNLKFLGLLRLHCSHSRVGSDLQLPVQCPGLFSTADPALLGLVRFWSTQSLRFQQVSVYLDLKVSAILQGTSLPLSKTLFPARADFKAGFQLSRCRGHHTGAMRKQRLGKLLSAWNTAWFGKIIIMIIIIAVATAEVCHWKPTILNNCDS